MAARVECSAKLKSTGLDHFPGLFLQVVGGRQAPTSKRMSTQPEVNCTKSFNKLITETTVTTKGQ